MWSNFLEIEQSRRHKGEYIDQNDHDTDLVTAKEMITQRLQHLLLIVRKLDRHEMKLRLQTAEKSMRGRFFSWRF
jgi:hypothetical protein